MKLQLITRSKAKRWKEKSEKRWNAGWLCQGLYALREWMKSKPDDDALCLSALDDKLSRAVQTVDLSPMDQPRLNDFLWAKKTFFELIEITIAQKLNWGICILIVLLRIQSRNQNFGELIEKFSRKTFLKCKHSCNNINHSFALAASRAHYVEANELFGCMQAHKGNTTLLQSLTVVKWGQW